MTESTAGVRNTLRTTSEMTKNRAFIPTLGLKNESFLPSESTMNRSGHNLKGSYVPGASREFDVQV